MDGQLRFPFIARCIKKRTISSLKLDDEVELVGMPPEDECQEEMFVTIRREKDGLAVPLAQSSPIRNVNRETKEAIEDWLYWVDMGYEFG